MTESKLLKARRQPRVRGWVAGLFVGGLLLMVLMLLPGGYLLEPEPEPSARRYESVILLHGMGRTRVSMSLLARRLAQVGYEVHLFGYSPRTESLDDVSLRLRDYLNDHVESPKYHFVGHSLGNVIVRNGLRFNYRPGLDRVVMIAPPNGPAATASALQDYSLYQWWTGDSGQKLADEDFYDELPVPSVPFGVIAGDRGHSMTFDEPNDGVVRVENTKLDGMTDWIRVHRTHTFIMVAPETFEYTRRFLETGAFR